MKRNLMGGGVDISLPNVSYCEDVKDVHYNPYNTVEFYVGEITEPQTVSIYTEYRTSIPIQVSEGNRWYTYVLPKDKELHKIEGESVKKVIVKANINLDSYSIPHSTVEASFKGSNTSKATSMYQTFQGCRNLTSLDVSSFDTSNVINMYDMFYECSRLTSLDVSSFDTSNVTSMEAMFQYCSNLTSLDLSNFNTSNVTIMEDMFADCYRLTSLDISGWDTSKVTDMGSMFRSAPLKTIRMVGCSEDTINNIKTQLGYNNITGVTIVTE